eukprot:TRINITY_DN2792_c0_g4_i1.p1 TRINITY_DN2792_c0_g4~~TRINITY_DN2792_c0_g4_i1.p1  ORF type:complete len:135 (+),score=36.78 TRINITY_DN2792_c0_g4_i1:66-470(+)
MDGPPKEIVDIEDFLLLMEEYQPTIPDEVTAYYLNRTGFNCDDIRVKRMVALAAQKFISDIANDALQYCKMRQSQQKSHSKEKGDKKLILTIEDLQQSLSEYGISIKKPEYFTDRVAGPSSSSSSQPKEKGKTP